MSLHDGKNQSFPYSSNQGLLARRLQKFPTISDVPHLYWNTLNSGLTCIYQKRSSKVKTNATGKGGGFQSSDYLPDLINTFVYCQVSP